MSADTHAELATWTGLPADELTAIVSRFNSRSDIQLYHLGLGAGGDPLNPRELRHLVDDIPRCCRRSGASRRRSMPPRCPP